MTPYIGGIINTMDYHETQIRKFMTVLFTERAKRHLKTLAVEYGWSSQMLAEYETRFIKPVNFVPFFV